MLLRISFYLFFVLLLSCNNSETRRSTNQLEIKVDSTTNERSLLIEELKKLKQIIHSKKAEKIAEIFSFPISDSTVQVYNDNSAFNAQLKSDNNKISEQNFLNHFNVVSENIWLDQVDNLFKYLNIDSLNYKESLQFDNLIKKEPCYYSYKISVDKQIVTLRVDMNSNNSFKSINRSEDIPENSSEICEHNLWWNFQFDGRKLHLINISGAG